MRIDYQAMRNNYTNGTALLLAKQLLVPQIDAAKKLYLRCRWWKLQEEVFHIVQADVPGFGLEATFAKLTLVDRLYKTSEYFLEYVAEHITNLLSSKPDYETYDPVSMVEHLSTYIGPNSDKPRHCWSLASKFAHFFIDGERFPIYDTYAKKMIAYHLFGRFTDIYKDRPAPYEKFYQDFHLLKILAEIECTNRELDRYLWLRGQFCEWRKNREEIRGEVAALFISPQKEIQEELNDLEGYEPPN